MSNDVVMRGFPPDYEHLVTLGNWRRAPYNRWSFHHVREFIGSANIPNDPSNVREIPTNPSDVSTISYDDGGSENTVRGMLDGTENDAIVVLHKGCLVYEEYANGMTTETPHILFSVSKSVTAMVAGIAMERGALEADALVTDYIPEMARSAYEGATVRNLLDMTAGVTFVEDYTASEGPIVQYREASGWNPRTTTPADMHLRGFLTSMTGVEKDHGGQFRYISPNTDLLGWVIERATDTRFADFMSETIWKPMGASRDAYVVVDGEGAPRTAGGICSTARDLALFGQLMADSGRRDGTQIIPEDWINDTRSNGDLDAWNCGDYADEYPDWGMRYRNKWYVMGESDAPFIGIGIHTQFLFVDPEREFVCAKFSSSPDAVSASKETSFLRACCAMANAL